MILIYVMESKKHTLDELQKLTDQWITSIGIRYFNELTNMTLLMEEVGELARLMARTYGEQSFKESDKQNSIGEEMADVLWVLICLANQTGINLEKEFMAKYEKRTKRDKLRHKKNEKLNDSNLKPKL